MARDNYGWNDNRDDDQHRDGKRSDGDHRAGESRTPPSRSNAERNAQSGSNMGGRSTRNNRDDYYGNQPSQNDRFGQGDESTSGSDGGRGFGASWSSNRERGNSDYDHGAYDDGNAGERSYGQGVYDQRPGQSGQQSGRGAQPHNPSRDNHSRDQFRGDRSPGNDSGGRQQYTGLGERGRDGGQARGNQFGNTGGDNYGGGGQNGGYGGDSSSQAGSHAGRGPKGWKRSDERIRDDVSEQLERHHELDASDIEVTVAGGEITLTGTVGDRRAKRLAEDIVHEVPGVTDVHNQIRVKKEDRLATRPTTES